MMPDDDYPHPLGLHVSENREREAKPPFAEARGSAACSNCGETVKECACMRSKCVECGAPVGNITFTVCDECWDKEIERRKKWQPNVRMSDGGRET